MALTPSQPPHTTLSLPHPVPPGNSRRFLAISVATNPVIGTAAPAEPSLEPAEPIRYGRQQICPQAMPSAHRTLRRWRIKDAIQMPAGS